MSHTSPAWHHCLENKMIKTAQREARPSFFLHRAHHQNQVPLSVSGKHEQAEAGTQFVKGMSIMPPSVRKKKSKRNVSTDPTFNKHSFHSAQRRRVTVVADVSTFEPSSFPALQSSSEKLPWPYVRGHGKYSAGKTFYLLLSPWWARPPPPPFFFLVEIRRLLDVKPILYKILICRAQRSE